jgi:High potential iron-sulfur protein
MALNHLMRDIMETKVSRRTVLVRCLQLPVSGIALFGVAACGKGDKNAGAAAVASCANPETMSSTEASTRASLKYTDASPNPQQVCGGCSFFHADQGNCGKCDMLSGGLVNGGGHCDSWNPRAA